MLFPTLDRLSGISEIAGYTDFSSYFFTTHIRYSDIRRCRKKSPGRNLNPYRVQKYKIMKQSRNSF